MIHVNDNLRFYKAYHSLTHADIAERIDVTIYQSKSYQNDAATPPIEVCVRIADMLDVSLDTLIRQKITVTNYAVLKRDKLADIRITEVADKLDNMEQRIAAMEKRNAKK